MGSGCMCLNVGGAHKNAVMFGGTRVLRLDPGEPACTPDGGCLAVAHWPRKQRLQQDVSPSWALSVFR